VVGGAWVTGEDGADGADGAVAWGDTAGPTLGVGAAPEGGAVGELGPAGVEMPVTELLAVAPGVGVAFLVAVGDCAPGVGGAASGAGSGAPGTRGETVSTGIGVPSATRT